MAEPSPIAQVEERLQDLIDALRQVGRADLARMLEIHGQDFTSPSLVRRSVSEIKRQLERWRAPGSELPDTPRVGLAANRLEDACNEALASGVIAAARPSIGAHARRKLGVVLVTLLGAAAVMLIGIALVRAGIELDQLGKPVYVEHAELSRDSEAQVRVSALGGSLMPSATTAVSFEPLPGCVRPRGRDVSCTQVQARTWHNQPLPTYEVKLPNQAYGLLFAIAGTELIAGKRGVVQLLLIATADTPEGEYEIPLRAAYHGYTPQRCELLERLQDACPPPRVGPEERHRDVPVPPLVVRVLAPDPEQRRVDTEAEAERAAQAQRLAEQRAEEITGALTEIQAAVKATELLGKKGRWEQAREQLQKLRELFAPLDTAALAGEAHLALPADVGKVRARYEALHEQLQAFEEQVFDATFSEVTAATNRAVAEERILSKVGKRFRISVDYVQSIYTDRAEEIQRRLEARARVHLEKVKAEQQAREQRCGPLPTGAYKTIAEYLRAALAAPRVEIELGECLTPRLTERECWEVRCDYRRKEEVAIERPRVVTKHSATVFLVHGRVNRHR